MNKKTINVLQINKGSQFDGVSSFLFNLYSKIDRDTIQFTFLSPNRTSYSMRREEIENMGGKIVELKANGNYIVRYCKLFINLSNHLKNYQYDFIHINSGGIFFDFFISVVSRNYSNAKIIIHSHNGGDKHKSRILKKILKLLKPFIETNADFLFSCSGKASGHMFTEKAIKNGKVVLIHDGIDPARFQYNRERRERLRKELGITDKFVLGNIGRFAEQKNQLFLIDVLSEIKKKYNNAILIIYGEGELKEKILNKAKEKGVEKDVFIYDPIRNLEDAYNIMDVFLLPSLYEGLPITGIEAQAMSLPAIFSDNVTKEVDISGMCEFISLNEPIEVWCNAIEKYMNYDRKSNPLLLKEAGYDMNIIASNLADFYINNSKDKKDA